MSEISVLSEAGRDLVVEDDAFPSDPEADPPREELERHVQTLEVASDVELNLAWLHKAVERALGVFDTGRQEQRTRLDSALAPVFHQCLDVPTRVASHIGFWQYLALFEFSHLIDARWGGRDGIDVEEKYLGTQKDLYSNHVARLWWGAELTFDGDDYLATHRLFEKQRLVNYVLDSSFRRYRPAAIAFAETLWTEQSGTIDAVASRFNDSLSTIQLETRSRTEVRNQLKQIREHVG